jgi:hypothetical protein
MYKAIFSIFILGLSVTSFAQELTCLDKLLPYNRHSGLHQALRDEWTDGKEALDAEGAESALKFLTNSKLMCRTGEITIKLAPHCSQTIADLPQSNTCFVFTNVGYFVLTRDNVRNVNFIFSRDKMFSE